MADSFIDIIKFELLKDLERDNVNNALDNIVKTNNLDRDAFAQAIVNHKEFWDQVAHDLVPGDAATFLDQHVGTDLLPIRQAAATQRVKFSLTSNPDILIDVLRHNSEECRAYLAERVYTALNDIPDRPKILLTNASLIEIKDEATRLLAIHYIKTVSDEETAKQIADLGKLKEMLLSKIPNMTTDFLDKHQEQLSLIALRQPTALKLKDVRAEFEKFVEKIAIDKELLLGKRTQIQKALLDYEALGTLFASSNAQGINFYTAYENNATPELNDRAAGKAIKERLETTYLNFIVAEAASGKKLADVQSLLSAENIADFRTAVKNLLSNEDDKAILDKFLIKDEQLQEYKRYFDAPVVADLIEVIAKLPKERVEDLYKADTFETFKEKIKPALNATQVSLLNYVKDTHFESFKAAVYKRTFAFEIHTAVKKDWRISSESRHELLHQFSKVPLEQQAAILRNNEVLPNVLTAKNTAELGNFFGEDVSQKEALIAENVRLSFFKKINNFVIAKVLANFAPAITLNAQQIEAINQRIMTQVSGGHPYSTFVKELMTVCAIVPEQQEQFYKSFGLQADGTTPVPDNKISKAIANQQKYNASIFEAYRAGTIDRAFADLLLRTYKKEKFQCTNWPGAQNSFLKSATIDEFITDYGASVETSFSKNKDELDWLSAEELQAVRKQMNSSKHEKWMKILTDNDNMGAVLNVLSAIESEITNIPKLPKSYDVFNFIKNINDTHLLAPAFRNRAEEARAYYAQMDKDVSVALAQLQRSIQSVQDLIDSIPETVSKTGIHDDTRIKLRKELVQMKQRALAVLEQGQGIKNKLSGPEGLLAKIDGVQAQTRKLAIHGEQIRVYLADEQSLGDTKVKNSAIVRGDISPTQTSSMGLKASLVEKPKEGELLAFDVTYNSKDVDKTGAGISYAGRFVYNPGRAEDRVITARGDKISHSDTGRFEIRQFPQGDPKAPGLKAAKVELALAMAIQALAERTTTPSQKDPIVVSGVDEDVVRHLWTALVVLGEENPNMKFGRDAIKVRSNFFDPKKEKGLIFGLSNNSLYHNVFKAYKKTSSVTEMVDAISQVSVDKKAGEKIINPKIDKASKITGLFKTAVGNARLHEREEAEKKLHGTAPEVVIKPSGPK